jgi:DNA-binding IclR family transcriptional regulator
MGLTRYTMKSVTDPRQFLKEVAKAKEEGYAVDDEEYMAGVRAIAASIRAPSAPPAAIWAVGFTSTLDGKKMETVISEIRGPPERSIRRWRKPSKA